MTGTNVETRARALLADEQGTSRWSAATLLMWLNDGQHLIWDRRPDARYADNGTYNTFAEAATLGDTLVIGDVWRLALAHFVAAKALSQDNADTENIQVAAFHEAQFNNRLEM